MAEELIAAMGGGGVEGERCEVLLADGKIHFQIFYCFQNSHHD